MSGDMVEQNYQPYCESCPLKQPKFETMYTSRGDMIINIECENKSLCAYLYDWLTDKAKGRTNEQPTENS